MEIFCKVKGGGIAVCTGPPDHLAYTLRNLSNEVNRVVNHQTQNTETLTGIQFGIVDFVAHCSENGEDAYQRDVETAFRIRRSTATTLLQRMERHGLLHREGVPQDARLKKILLTGKAHRLHRNTTVFFTQLEQALTEGISPEELSLFTQTAEKLSHNLERIGEDAI